MCHHAQFEIFTFKQQQQQNKQVNKRNFILSSTHVMYFASIHYSIPLSCLSTFPYSLLAIVLVLSSKYKCVYVFVCMPPCCCDKSDQFSSSLIPSSLMSYVCRVFRNGPGGSHDRTLRAEAGTTKEHCLLACSQSHTQLAFLHNPGPSA